MGRRAVTHKETAPPPPHFLLILFRLFSSLPVQVTYASFSVLRTRGTSRPFTAKGNTRCTVSDVKSNPTAYSPNSRLAGAGSETAGAGMMRWTMTWVTRRTTGSARAMGNWRDVEEEGNDDL
ncbi:hypothetical protein BCR44DRAFT_355176 [Catenaria anguillulae PL171]|uniref:Uncharacterized protein n=1 Tax=Catenaria anguillulae PL171 TaxID=765915 RepID=A0A1Y2I231_9FUNG|nr:hypothetical protein BCR44DRAFT_355176 [Catenaria anguillulae PL171]